MNPSPILCMTASVDVQISEIQNISELYEVVITVGVVDEEKACNKHALACARNLEEVSGELSTHVARINGCSKDCSNLEILYNNSVSHKI